MSIGSTSAPYSAADGSELKAAFWFLWQVGLDVYCRGHEALNYTEPSELQHPSPSQLCLLARAVIPLPLIILLRNGQVWQLLGHDPTRRRARHDAVLREVGDAGVVAQEILVEEELAVDD